MCTVCGCGTTSLGDQAGDRAHAAHDHGHPHRHGKAGDHAHEHHHSHGEGHDDHKADGGAIDLGAGLAGLSVAGLSQERIISIERDILSKNDAFAHANRDRLRETKTFALNLLSSPGAGKTSLLVRTITDLRARWPIAVIEGDQQTSNDAERIRETGAEAVQINTGKGCHLDAHMVGHALDQMALEPDGLLFIENVGNLVCPAAFDLGEAFKVVVLSVTEGEDKPLKYPDMFAAADLMLLNKSDLLPHLDYDVSACFAAAIRVNPGLQILTVSARTGEGLTAFYAWIEARAAMSQSTMAEVA
jgi:hydrogenase nickel incorporation protein HypB